MLRTFATEYVLHGTNLSEIFPTDEAIVVNFEQGIYYWNEFKDIQQTGKCSVRFYIYEFDKTKAYQNCEIKIIKSNVIEYIDFYTLIQWVKKYGMKIYIDYYSFLSKSILLIGTSNEYSVELTITDIVNVVIDTID